jgi:hypothetical protein
MLMAVAEYSTVVCCAAIAVFSAPTDRAGVLGTRSSKLYCKTVKRLIHVRLLLEKFEFFLPPLARADGGYFFWAESQLGFWSREFSGSPPFFT